MLDSRASCTETFPTMVFLAHIRYFWLSLLERPTFLDILSSTDFKPQISRKVRNRNRNMLRKKNDCKLQAMNERYNKLERLIFTFRYSNTKRIHFQYSIRFPNCSQLVIEVCKNSHEVLDRNFPTVLQSCFCHLICLSTTLC